MPEVIINGPEGRLECRYMPGEAADAPTALILHPEPDKGGTMNNRVTYALYKHFQARGFAVMRFNFRGVGRSEGEYDSGEGELSDAATAMDWLQAQNPASRQCWIAGFSFGAWICMQLMMRRPEIQRFISVTPPATTHDFSFLAPCPASGLIINGEQDDQVPPDAICKLVERLSIQKGVKIKVDIVPGANHFFAEHLELMISHVSAYIEAALLDGALAEPDFDPLA